MTTINVVDRFMEELDANPILLESVRSRLLTRELLELPQTVQRMAGTLDRFMESTDRRLNALESGQQRLEVLAEVSNKRLDALEAGQQRLEGIVRSMHTDVGKIRGVHAYQAVRRDAIGIAWDMGFRATDILRRRDLLDMIEAADTDEVSPDDLKSFRRSDLIMRGEDAEGGDFYIALEVSFTVHRRDRRRAVRNAELLTSFTGAPAFPVVAGLQINERERERVERGELLYYEIEEAALLPE